MTLKNAVGMATDLRVIIGLVVVVIPFFKWMSKKITVTQPLGTTSILAVELSAKVPMRYFSWAREIAYYVGFGAFPVFGPHLPAVIGAGIAMMVLLVIFLSLEGRPASRAEIAGLVMMGLTLAITMLLTDIEWEVSRILDLFEILAGMPPK